MLLADIGDQVTLAVAFTNAAGTPIAPTTVSLKVRKPDGTLAVNITTGYTNPSTGIYSYPVTVDTDGFWQWRWAGTGAAVAASEGTFRVRDSVFV